MAAQAQFELVDNGGRAIGIPAAPPTGTLVTDQVLHITGLNAQTFSGAMNPSTIYRQMVHGSPSVFPYYRELEEKDWEISDALDLRKTNVLARDSQVQAADADNPQAVMYAEYLAEFVQSIRNFRAVLRELLDGIGYGYSVMEILWRINGDASVGVEDIVGRPQELFRFGRLTEPQVGPLRLAKFPGGEGEIVPEHKFLVHRFGVRHGDRRGLPLLRRVFWLSWFKRNGLRLDLSFLEKPVGTVVVQYPAGAEQAVRDLAKALAQAIVEDSSAAAPENLKVMEALLSQARTRQGTDFSGLIEYCDAAIRRLIQKQTLTSRGSDQGKGTQALGTVHEGTEGELTRNDSFDLEDTVNEQLLRAPLVWQFGPEALERSVRPWWTIEKDQPKDGERELRKIRAAHSLLGETSKIPTEEVYNAAGLRAAEDDEETLPVAAPGINELLSGVPAAEPGAPEPREKESDDEEEEE